MRIIAGEHRGRVIDAPEGLDTRPTTDRVRESIMSSLFSILGGFDGVRVLDAFSGSGAMALEAMSRGADSCVMNDFSKASRNVIEANRESLGYTDVMARIASSDIMKSGLPRLGGPYGLVFLDPPYRTPSDEILSMVENAFEDGVLADDAIVVYEHGGQLPEGAAASHGLDVLSQKKYGKTHVAYLARAGKGR